MPQGPEAAVFPVVGAGAREAVQDLALRPGVRLVETPRPANVLLLAGALLGCVKLFELECAGDVRDQLQDFGGSTRESGSDGRALVGTLPTDVSSPLLVWLGRGNVSLPTVFNAVDTALSPVLVPVLFLAYTGIEFDVPVVALTLELAITVLVPTVVGVAVRTAVPRRIRPITPRCCSPSARRSSASRRSWCSPPACRPRSPCPQLCTPSCR